MRIRLGGMVLAIGMASAAGAWAQSPTPADLDAIQRQQQQILRDQEERQRALEQERRSNSRAVPQVRPQTPASEGAESDSRCVEVQRIQLDGLAETSESEVSEILAAHQGRCLALAEIDGLIRALTNRYIDLGYSTTRVYIPQQDLGSGTLRLIVQEGKVEKLQFDGDENGLKRGTAFPGVEGKVLNLRDIEQGLDQINRLRANNAKMAIAPGETTGGSVVTIDNTRQTPWFVTAGVDNSGSKSSGERQGFGQIEVDDILGANDLWTLDWRRSLSDQSGISKSESVSGFVSIPFGYWTASFSGSWFDYRSQVQASTQAFETTGASRVWKGRLERVIHRDADSKTTVSAALSVKDTFNYVEETRLDASSRRLTVATVDVTHSHRVLGGALNLGLAHDSGLHAMGAQSDADRSEASPEAQFEKWSADIGYWRPLPFPDERFNLSWSVAGHGQWSPDTLFSTERISVGSQYSVRGFKEQSASGDIGGYVRNDLRLTLPPTGDATADRLLGRAYVGVGYDVGAIRGDSDDAYERGKLQGVSLSLGTSGGQIPISATWAHPVSGPGFIDRSDVFYITMGVSF